MFWLGLLVVIFQSLSLTDGAFFYTLDDPYIHLALAEEILRGNYGVNPDETASPSSSILFPLLLTGLLALGLGDLAPLVLNAVAASVTIWLVSGVFFSSAFSPKSWWQFAGAVLMLPFLILAINLIGLTMTGMEHSLHVLASVSIILAMSQLDDGRPPSPWLLSGILFAPLLRFEGIALAIPALLTLLLSRRLLAVAVMTGSLVLALTVYVVLMTRLGLPALPSSVLTKSSISAAAIDRDILDLLEGIARTARDGLMNRGGALIGVSLALLILATSYGHKAARVPWRTVGVGSVAILAHIAAGNYGWFDRYEIYIIAIALVALLIAWSDALRSEDQSPLLKVLGLGTCLAIISVPYVYTLYRTPKASENIYAQQYQMHRFSAQFFSLPVAVNDLGYVSYRNDVPVLDLWGLGSEKARIMNSDGNRSAEDLRALTSDVGSVYAMIYSGWFEGDVPDEWCHIATLQTPQVSAAGAEVDFYLIAGERQDQMESALMLFSETLPPVSRLAINDCFATPRGSN